jgi:hypothetical protein
MSGNTEPIGELNERYAKEIRKGFEYRCIFTLIEGYKLMKEAGEYDCSWEEERLTAHLIKYMKHSLCSRTWKLDIIPEYPVYTGEIYNGIRKPKEAPRIDVRMMNWSNPQKWEYFIEAKNLAENDWRKPDGSKVNASHLRARYIDTGIDNFVAGRYPYGCLSGYILEGSVGGVIEGINGLLKSRRRNRSHEILNRNEPINSHSECYRSEHQSKSGVSMTLNHIFLSFN